jgi:hypothetical protein
MNERAQNITFTEMREMGVRGVLLVCGDYKCSHSIARPRVPAGDRLAQTPALPAISRRGPKRKTRDRSPAPMSQLGQSRLNQPVLPVVRCLLCTESDRDRAALQICREWDGPAALPPPMALRVHGGLSGAGAPPCLADPPFVAEVRGLFRSVTN